MRTIISILLLITISGCTTNSPKADPARDNLSSDIKPMIDNQQVECPLCGLKFKKIEAEYNAEYKDVIYYFLLKDHQRAFLKNPNSFLQIN